MKAPAREKILKFISEKKTVNGTLLRTHFGVSRQAINIHIQKLVEMGKVVRLGSKTGTIYVYAEDNEIKGKARAKKYYRTVKGLNPNEVFNYYSESLVLKDILNKNAYEIIKYAFISILNNALKYSETKILFIYMEVKEKNISFIIRDYGIGIFYALQKIINVKSEYLALASFITGNIKGMDKKTVFFLSKLADKFQIKSHRLNVVFNNLNNSIVAESIMKKRGSYIKFTIKRRTNKRLDKYKKGIKQEAPYLTLKLFRKGKRYVLTQLKLMAFLNGFDRFDRLTLDIMGEKRVPEYVYGMVSEFLSKRGKSRDVNIKNAPKSFIKMLEKRI